MHCNCTAYVLHLYCSYYYLFPCMSMIGHPIQTLMSDAQVCTLSAAGGDLVSGGWAPGSAPRYDAVIIDEAAQVGWARMQEW